MNILFMTSEAAPFSASGGLGDVMGALPKAMLNLPGVDGVSCILPLYQSLKDEYRCKLQKVIDIQFYLGWRKTGASIYSILHQGVVYYFVENHYYFGRRSLYGEYDDGERFAFFSRAVVEYMKQSGNVPDILHANDWQSALGVVYLKTIFQKDEQLSKVRTVYTIHNIEYQGKFSLDIIDDVFGISSEFSNILTYDGCTNLMKAAIVCSDYVTTVSPNYAKELKYDFFSFGLSPIVRDYENKMAGIINGIDYSVFSPENGIEISHPFGIENLKEGKLKNKLAFQRELKLREDESVPLIAVVTRLASQKGIDLLLHILDELLEENIQLVVLGTGEKEYEDALFAAEFRYPDKMRALIKFDRALSKRIYASADLFLMPSKSEPCGLAQMISCSYGTIPLVRAVGGLYDTITPYGEEGSIGFTFENYNAHELLFKIKEALGIFHQKEEWAALVCRAKQKRFTWDASAQSYLDIYNKLI